MLSLTNRAWRWNVSLVRSPSDAALFATFHPDPERAAARIAERRPSLCVFLTTYERPSAMERMLPALGDALRRAQRSGEVASWHVIVVDDASSESAQRQVQAVLERELGDAATLLCAGANNGKRGYWRVHALIHRLVLRIGCAHTLFLQDDLEFEPSFVERALATWRTIEDPHKQALFLLRLSGDEPTGRWVHFPRVPGPVESVDLTQWLDLNAFLVGEAFFATLRHRIFPVPLARWKRRPLLSSGVGEQLTLRLFGRGNVYQVRETLVRHGKEPSRMNAEARALRPLRSDD